jgi:hypothetical protein
LIGSVVLAGIIHGAIGARQAPQYVAPLGASLKNSLMTRKHGLLPIVVLALLAARGLEAAEADSIQEDEKMLADAGVRTTTPALLDFLRSRAWTPSKRAEVQKLIGQLGHKSFRVRQRASAALAQVGWLGIVMLEEARRSADPEIRMRATECLKAIHKTSEPFLPAAAVRLLSTRKAPALAAALLDFLPYAGNSVVEDETRFALGRLAVRDGKVDPALLKAIGDEHPLRRAVAAEALCLAGAAAELPRAKLLTDPDKVVRLRAALALARAHDKAAIPVLIDLLGALGPEEAWPAHNLLWHLGGENSPDVPLGKDEATRARCRDAWLQWWKQHGDGLSLTLLEAPARQRGLTLVVLLDAGRILELSPEGRPRWQIDKVASPLDAQVLSERRVLIVEYGSSRVTVRDRKGGIVWEVKARHPIAAQRLANGNTFIVTRGHLIEVDARGQEIFSFTVPGSTFTTARRFPDGRIAYIINGHCTILGSATRKLATFSVGRATTTSCLDVLPNGHIVVAEYMAGKVAELDLRGKRIWEVATAQPIGVTALPNGHVLIASHAAPQVVEINRSGKIVWQTEMSGHPTQARRR